MRKSPTRCVDPLAAPPSASYQCLLASAVQQVDKVAAIEQVAEEAALSLGQRERIGALLEETNALRVSLVKATDARARALLTPQTTWLGRVKARVAAGSGAASVAASMHWEPALREARRVVADAADCLRTIGASLPAGGAEAALADQVDDLLRRHQHVLGTEMTRWAA